MPGVMKAISTLIRLCSNAKTPIPVPGPWHQSNDSGRAPGIMCQASQFPAPERGSRSVRSPETECGSLATMQISLISSEGRVNDENAHPAIHDRRGAPDAKSDQTRQRLIPADQRLRGSSRPDNRHQRRKHGFVRTRSRGMQEFTGRTESIPRKGCSREQLPGAAVGTATGAISGNPAEGAGYGAIAGSTTISPAE